MIATLSDFNPSVSFALLDESLAAVNNQHLASLNYSDLSYSLETLYEQHKSVTVEAARTLAQNGLALIVKLDGADYPSFLLLKYQQLTLRVDNLLHNYCLQKDRLLFTRLASPGTIRKLCFNSLKELTLLDEHGFCTPLRLKGNTLYYLKETQDGSHLRALNLSRDQNYLVSDTYQVICHSEAGWLLKTHDEEVFFSTFGLTNSRSLSSCCDYYISVDSIYSLEGNRVYQLLLNRETQELIADEMGDQLLYADKRWILTCYYDCLNRVTYILYDRKYRKYHQTKVLTVAPVMDSFSYTHQQIDYTFHYFQGSGQTVNRSVIISVYEGFDVDNQPSITEEDQEHWLNKGHDIIVFNALKRIKAENPTLSNTQAKLKSLALLAALCTDCKQNYGYANCLLLGVSHGGMMALSCILTYPDTADAVVAISPLVNLQTLPDSDYYFFWRKEFELDQGENYLQLCPTNLIGQTKKPISILLITFEGDKIIDSQQVARFYCKCKKHNVRHVHFDRALGHATNSDKASVSEGYEAVYGWVYREVLLNV